MPLHKHLFNYVSNRCLHKGTIENSESMFPKKKGKKKYQMTEECNCLPLKYILNSSTENLLEHFGFVQVITEFDQSDTFWGTVEHFRSSGMCGVSRGTRMRQLFVLLHMDPSCWGCTSRRKHRSCICLLFLKGCSSALERDPKEHPEVSLHPTPHPPPPTLAPTAHVFSSGACHPGAASLTLTLLHGSQATIHQARDPSTFLSSLCLVRVTVITPQLWEGQESSMGLRNNSPTTGAKGEN